MFVVRVWIRIRRYLSSVLQLAHCVVVLAGLVFRYASSVACNTEIFLEKSD